MANKWPNDFKVESLEHTYSGKLNRQFLAMVLSLKALCQWLVHLCLFPVV